MVSTKEVRRRYEALVAAGTLQPDAAQLALAERLDMLAQLLGEHCKRAKKSALGWLFAQSRPANPPKGLYIWGGVGRGKTLLMDIFFDAAQVRAKRRVHFHAFMGEIHDRIARFREALRSGAARGDDPIPPVAADIAAEARLLCFDEFAVNDIADAMILGRLFERLFAAGTVIVATSNVAPEDLYRDGLNRALFLPFISALQERMDVVHLDSLRDYRADAAGVASRYLTPLGPAAEAGLALQFQVLTGSRRGAPCALSVRSRKIAVPEAAGGVARFGFADLCGKPLAAGDYGMIAGVFHTVILAGVPVLGPAERNEAKRFILLIDTLYDRGVRLIVSAAEEPDALWRGGDDSVEAREFARTASRLVEMRSEEWWRAAATRAPAGAKKARAG